MPPFDRHARPSAIVLSGLVATVVAAMLFAAIGFDRTGLALLGATSLGGAAWLLKGVLAMSGQRPPDSERGGLEADRALGQPDCGR